MRNGFKLTLMVAIALTGMRASAMAPTMNPIPDPIVGDSDGVSGTNEFVYPDALNLNNYATDPDNGPSPLVWSYEGEDATYTFNGVAGLAPADDPVNPGTKSINDRVVGGEVNPDANLATVTIRNTNLSPIGGPNGPDPGPAGIIASETKVITLYASDGATYSQKEIVVYSDNEGIDQLSSGEEPVAAGDFAGGPEGWQFTGSAGVTSSSAGALCITVPALGDNDAQWASPYDLVELTAGSVYIGRFNLSTSQAVVGNVPLTVVLFENTGFDAFDGANLYFQETYFLDNFGGANTPTGLKEVLFTPMPVSTQEWNDNAFTPTNDPINDARLRFRILDIGSAFYNANGDSGQVCVLDYAVTKVDISALNRGAAIYEDSSLTDPEFNVTSFQSTISYAGGNITATPTDGNYEGEIVAITPGDGSFDLIAGTNILDDYPVPFTVDGTWYEVVIGMSAPNASSASNPPDVIRMGMDSPTNEFIGLSWMTPSLNDIATPNVGAEQLYRGFYAPNSVTDSPSPNNQVLRPRFDFLTDPALGFDIGGAVNAGGTTVHSFAVYEVTQ